MVEFLMGLRFAQVIRFYSSIVATGKVSTQVFLITDRAIIIIQGIKPQDLVEEWPHLVMFGVKSFLKLGVRD